jgi:selenocysteine lyase/cysteine desulfurase
LGKRCDPRAATRRDSLKAAYATTVPYERALLIKLVDGLKAIPGVRIFGITEPGRFEDRCATLSFRMGERNPTEIATFLGERGIFTWDGNFYALNLSERLGVEQHGGMLRIGLVHYNTAEEVERLLAALRDLAVK